MKIIATARHETTLFEDGTLCQTTKKVVQITSTSFDELELDDMYEIVLDALKKVVDSTNCD